MESSGHYSVERNFTTAQDIHYTGIPYVPRYWETANAITDYGEKLNVDFHAS